MLTREIGAGGSVAILGGDHGLRAISSDGARERVLVHAPVWFVLVDTRANVIWYGVGKQLRAIDLEASAPPKEITVVDDVPTGPGMVGALNVSINYAGDDPEIPLPSTTFALSGAVVYRTISLSLGIGSVAFSGSGGYEQSEEFTEAIKRARVVDTTFARTLHARRDHSPPFRQGEEFTVPGIDPANCEDPARCGAATRIAGTHYAKVVVGDVAGAIRHIDTQLYDIDAKRFVAGAEDWFANLDTTVLAPDGTAFITRGAVVRFAGGPLPSTPLGAASGGGFLGGLPIY